MTPELVDNQTDKTPGPRPLDVFYPIVPDIDWLERLVPLGIKTVQLRLKDAPEAEVRRQVKRAIEVCHRHDCQLIVNDYWRTAIELGADYIHLGQEDLADADLGTVRKTGIKFGLSTHSHEELKIALDTGPDYIALGPVYETSLKAMKWQPQGLARVGEWKNLIGTVPLVAIAGITLERAPGVVAAGADSIAVITDFLTHSDPSERIRQWLSWAGSVTDKATQPYEQPRN